MSVLDYRVIFVIVGVVTLAGAAHIGFWLREQIRTDWRAGRGGVSRRGPATPSARISSAKTAAPAMRTPSTTSSAVMPRRWAHWVQTRHLSVGDDGRQQVRNGAARCRSKVSARPGSANHAASPVSHRPTSAPAATAAAATVNAWLQRSGSSAPQVTFTTSFRDNVRDDSWVIPQH